MITDLTEGKPSKILWSFSIPMLLSVVFQQLYNIVDSIVAGKFVGAQALAAVGASYPITMIFMAIATGANVGAAVIISQLFGAKNFEKLKTSVFTSIISMTVLAAILTIFGIVFCSGMLKMLSTPENIFSDSMTYLNIYIGGLIFLFLYNICTGIFTAMGDSKTPLYFLLMSSVGNIILDLVFVIVFNMGVAGAAIATVISQIASAIWTVGFLLSKKATYTIKLRHMIRLNSRRIKKILSLGLAGFTMLATNAAVQMVCNMTLKQYGSDLYIGIMTIITSVRDILVLPVQGFSQGAQPVLGYNYGAEKNGRVKKAIKYMSVILISYTVLAWMTVAVFPQFFIRIFTENADLLAGGVPALHIYFFGFFFMALQFCAQTVFTALDKPKQAVFFSMFRKIIIVVPMTVLLPIFWTPHVNGVFWAEPISNLIGGAAAFTTMILTVYKKL